MDPSHNNRSAELSRLQQSMTNLIQDVFYGECREKGDKVREIFDEYVFKKEPNPHALIGLTAQQQNRFNTLRADYQNSTRQRNIKNIFIEILQGLDDTQKPYDFMPDAKKVPLPLLSPTPAAAAPPATLPSLDDALKRVTDHFMNKRPADQHPRSGLDTDHMAALKLHQELNEIEVQDPDADIALALQMQANWDADATKDPSLATQQKRQRLTPEKEEITLANDLEWAEEVDPDTLLARQLQKEEEEAAAQPKQGLHPIAEMGRPMNARKPDDFELTPKILALLDTGKKTSDDRTLYIADLGISVAREPRRMLLQENADPRLKLYYKDEVVVNAGTKSKLIEGSDKNLIRVEPDCTGIEIQGIKDGRVEVEGSSVTISNATNCKIQLKRALATFRNVTGCTIDVSKDSKIDIPEDLYNKNTIND